MEQTERKMALRVSDKDNVATTFSNGVTKGTEVEVRDKRGNVERIAVLTDIPYAHKISVRDIRKGEEITKYGEEIGMATRDISRGEHVHVQNMDSMRGRGDLVEGK